MTTWAINIRTGIGLLCLLGVLGAALPAQGAWQGLGTFEVTAYCPCEACVGRWYSADPDARRTKAGTRPHFGVLAADWSVLPCNSVIRIEGWHEQQFVVEDTGRLVTGQTIDIYMDSHRLARQWGRQRLRIWRWETERVETACQETTSYPAGETVKIAKKPSEHLYCDSCEWEDDGRLSTRNRPAKERGWQGVSWWGPRLSSSLERDLSERAHRLMRRGFLLPPFRTSLDESE